MRQTTKIGLTIALTFALVAACVVVFKRSRMLDSQPALQFVKTTDSGTWIPYGGVWRPFSGGIQNDSEERGAKLMSGSESWSDYFVEADVQILGPYGDAGLMLRSGDEEEGVDAYHGYYAVLRNMNDSLTLGRADYGLNQFVVRPLEPGMGDQEWFHLKLLASGCDIVAIATSAAGKQTSAAAHDPRCIRRGRFGLRSFSTSARWKNIRIGPATHADMLKALGQSQLVEIAYKGNSISTAGPPRDTDRYLEPIRREAQRLRMEQESQPIDTLLLRSSNHSEQATVHGVVTLASPDIYIQDATGAIKAPQAHLSGPVKVGDEVEANGEVVTHDLRPILEEANIRVLFSGVPIPALAVTAFELATGNRDGQFVEVEGELQSIQTAPRNEVILHLTDGSQGFYAIADPAELNVPSRLEPRSRLRLRGVVTVDTKYTGSLVSFALLLPSADSVEVIEDPPWWNLRHSILLIFSCLFLLLLAFAVLHRVQQWNLESILDERERLALEMHDTLAQSFAGIGFQLQAIREETKHVAPAEKQIQIALGMVRTSHEEARRSIAALRPRFLSNDDLVHALRDAATRMVEGDPVTVLTSTAGSMEDVPLRISDALFRIGQEAISNAVRHSCATTISISAGLAGTEIFLTVRDDGRGFDTSDHALGFGIRGMAKRADNIGGILQITSAPGKGTSVTATVQSAIRQSFWQRKFSINKLPQQDLNP
jgi:signal transduction histidine kinase